MLRSLARAACLTAALALTAAAASAQLITFTFSGIGSGVYGSTPFTAQPFVVTIGADLTTSAYGSPISATSVQFSNLTGATITIGGGVLTNGVFDVPLFVFDARATNVIGFGTPSRDLLDLFFPIGGAAATYDLRGPLGPITTSIVGAVGQFSFIPVSGQLLTFTSVPTATFQAVGPRVAFVPEPATFVLVSGALVVFGGAAARRRRRAG